MTTKKTQRELILEYWGRVHDMCDSYNKQHGTNIKPQQCVKYYDIVCGSIINHHVFDASNYDLAVAIIEDMPVFLGDKIYYKLDGSMHTVGNNIPVIVAYNWTLKAPKKKRTFELNGKQLPCPSNSEFCKTHSIDILGQYYYFDYMEDRNKVARAIIDLLDNARDKE
ncbi:MAG: hypothetical protein WC107_04775 [Patescibacteria group bacterium]